MRGKVLVVHSDDINEEEFIRKNQMFVQAARSNNIQLNFRSSTSIYTYIDNNCVKCHDTFGTYNYALFFCNDTWLAKNLEMLGVKVVNSSKSMDICQNKARMYQALAEFKINIPKTVILPLYSVYTREKASKFISDTLDDLGLPVVVKEWFGQDGEHVYLAKTKEDLFKLLAQLGGQRLLMQEYILESSGTDIRMFVIKNKVVAAVRRQGAPGDFRSNVSLGGSLNKYIPTYLDEELAVNATKAVGCDYAVVDILKSINGPVVCEVNAAGNVNNFIKMSGVNLPDLLLKSIK